MDIELNRRPFSKEMMLFQLDTALMASEEVSYNAMDAISGEKTRDLIRKCFASRDEKAFNVGRLTAIGRRPMDP